MSELVHLDWAAGVATITLDSPANRNALSAALMRDLATHLQTAIADEDVRVIVLTATGTVFCAGADLKNDRAAPSPGTSYPEILVAIMTAPKPVIAALNGHVRAGGIGLVAACDMVVAPTDATFAFAEVRIGVAPAVIGVVCLRKMPSRAVSRYFLTGETFTADVAVAAGLVTLTARREDVTTRVAALTAEIRRTAPEAVARTKALIAELPSMDLAEGFAHAARVSAELFESDEAQAGITAFRERRRPPWDTSAVED
ncbi:MAG TPA: enoyl-CoA hydratase-related protein [Acidimicrobiales bacterium]